MSQVTTLSDLGITNYHFKLERKNRMKDTLANHKAFHTVLADAHVRAAKAHRSLATLHADNPKIAAEHTALADCAGDCADGHIRMCKALSADSNSPDIADVTPSTTVRGGNDPGGPTDKAFGMRAAMGSERDFTKIKPDGVRAVVPSAQFVPRPGGPGVQSPEDSTATIDSLKK
jgi:hypothetical protein